MRAKPYDFFTARPQGPADATRPEDPAMDLPAIGALSAANPAATPAGPAPSRAEQMAHKAATDFEASFLAEMLRYGGLNAMPDGFGGGAGEEAFASLLTDEYARLLAERGGIGLAEQVFEAIKQRIRDE
jgi:peptidoglycan hydrolase FlgJ